MKILVLDSWYNRLRDGYIPGGAEKAAQVVAQSLIEAGHVVWLYTPRPTDDSLEINGIPLIWSTVPVRKEWPDEKPATSRRFGKFREQDIEHVVRNFKPDLVINNSSSGQHVNALSRLRERTGVATLNFCHLSFSVGSFARFGLIQALQEHRRLGGVNITPSLANRDNMALLVKSRPTILYGIDCDTIFDGELHPSDVNHVPYYKGLVTKREKIFALTRFSKDKNADQLAKILIEFAKSGVPVEAHFASTHTGGLDMDGYVAQLRAAGAEVHVDVDQSFSFERARSALVHIMASHTTESFGIVPVEMAVLGVPTLYGEGSGPPHLSRRIIEGFGRPFKLGLAKRCLSEVIEGVVWAASFDETERAQAMMHFRDRYSREKFDIGLKGYCQLALDRNKINHTNKLDF